MCIRDSSISSPRLATKEVLIPNVKANKIDKLVQANATEYFCLLYTSRCV